MPGNLLQKLYILGTGLENIGRVYADYAGLFLGKMFLILAYTNTKWVDIHMVNSSSAEITIEKITSIFATLGLPQILVTDNGPQFTSGILHNLARKKE